jgi:hypothetical protein
VNNGLASLLASPGIWRASRAPASFDTLPTGYPALDARLPGGGWPARLLTEFLLERPGLGELSLVMPVLARLQTEARAAGHTGWVVWVTPPLLPYAPALAAAGLDPGGVLVVKAGEQDGADSDNALWAMEQALISGHCAAVLGWPGRAGDRQIRRLQLAAQTGGVPAMLFRTAGSWSAASAAALRLRLTARQDGIWLEALKSRGGRPFELPLASLLHA